MSDELCIIKNNDQLTMKTIRIYQAGSLNSNKAPEKNFTGDVYISDYFERPVPSRLISATVTFAPNARTPHPGGLTRLIKR